MRSVLLLKINTMKRYLLTTVWLLVLACSPKVVQKASEEDYYEDLSKLRPNIGAVETRDNTVNNSLNTSVSPIFHIRGEMDSVLSIVTNKNKERGYVNGYTIKVFSGNDRDQANEVRANVIHLAGEFEEGLEPFMKFYQPNYIINLGKFHSQLDALKTFNFIKEHYPSAIIVPDRIYLEF